MSKNKECYDKNRLKLLSDIAEMYYQQNLALKEISKNIGVSINQISRLLKQAETHGIVRITISKQSDDSIKKRLKEKYSLRDIRTVPFISNYDELRKLLGKEAAKYFEEIISNFKMSIGLDGGTTIYHMVDVLEKRLRKIVIYPLTYKWRGLKINYIDANVLVHLLRYKSLGAAEGFWMPLQLFMQDIAKEQLVDQKEVLIKNPEVKSLFEASQNIDVGFISLGLLEKDSSSMEIFNKAGITYDMLRKKGVVGMICGICYNEKGEPVDDHFFSFPFKRLQTLTKMSDKKVVLVVGGEHKINALEVLLKSSIGNVLITDEKTAVTLAS